MFIPTQIDPEAVRLLEEANWYWDDLKMAALAIITFTSARS